MIRKLRAGMMPPAGARRPDGGAARAAGHCAGDAHGRNRGRIARPGLAALSASQSGGVRARRQAARRSRRGRHRLPARRHDQQRLRQRLGRPDLLADADGGLPARGQPCGDPCRGRPCQRADAGHLQAAQDRVSARARRRRAARHAWRCVGRAHLRRRRRLRLQHGLLRRAARPALRQYGAERADGGVCRRCPRRPLRHRPAHERGEDGPHRQDRADPRPFGHAPRDGRVHPEVRGVDQRSHRTHRPHDGRHRDRHGLRHHHPPAPPQPQHRRAAPRHGCVRHDQPPHDLHVPADDAE